MSRRYIGKKHATYNWRFIIVMFGLSVLAVSLASRVGYLQVFDKEFLSNQADARSLRVEKMPANRGLISDRYGKALAVSTPVVSVWVNPKVLLKERAAWPALASALGMPFSELENRILNNQRKGFLYLSRHISPDEAEKVLALEIEGVYSEGEYRRFYPAGEVAAHLVGLTNIDDEGIEGIELAFDQRLSSRAGKRKVIKDRRGSVIKDLEIVEYPHSGEDIRLSIDLRAQYLAYKELAYAVEQFSAHSGSAIAIDIESGEILALVNQPSFNPNNRTSIRSDSLRNRAVTDLLEPGSTVKPFTVLAGLGSKQFNMNSTLDTRPGFIRVGSKTIRDHSNYGVMDMTTVLTKSSNVATTQIALALEHGELNKTFEKIGFGEVVGAGMPGESRGVLPMPHKNRPIETATMSYGYGLSVTSLQLANAYTILANHGVEKPLSILYQEKIPAGKQVLDAQTSRQIVEMLKTVVSNRGTASRAKVRGYSVAGKTGTVHRVVNGSYATDQYTSLFAGMAPASNPKVVLVVVINNPKGDEYYGGLVAAPVFSKIMEGILRVLDVPPDVPEEFKSALASLG